MRLGKKSSDGLWLEFSDEDHAAIRKQFTTDAAKPLAMPPLLAQLKGLATAAVQTAKAAAMGEAVLRTQEEQARYMAICAGCEFYAASEGRCSKCGCFAVVATRLATKSCPVGKWPAKTLDDI